MKQGAGVMMELSMHPTGPGHGVSKDSVDNNVFTGAWNIGRIDERKGFADAVRCFWSLHGVVPTRPPEIHADGDEPTLETAKARRKRWLERWVRVQEE